MAVPWAPAPHAARVHDEHVGLERPQAALQLAGQLPGEDGRPRIFFPNAPFVFLQRDWDYWMTPDDINAALKTYVPSGKWDDYYLFTSGGHSGNLIVIGVPSMRR